MSKFTQLSEQINFLIKMQQESLDECLQEFGQLINSIEKNNAPEKYDENYEQGIELVKNILHQNFDRMRADYDADIDYLRNQKQVLDAIKNVKDPEKQAELEKIVMEDTGELEDQETFKKKSVENNETARSMFIQTINDIKEIIDEGSLEEILNLCEEDQIEEAEKFYAENEDCEKDLHEDDKENFESFDLTTNEDIKKMFENLKEPFSLKVDERKDKK